MKKLLYLTAFISGLAMSNITQDNAFALGALVGEPTGLSAKYNLDTIQSVDMGLGWSFVNNGRFHFHADYLRHVRGIFKIENASFDLHYGIGGRVKTRESNDRKKKEETDAKIGVRAPVGLNYSFIHVPIELFLEAALVLDLVPKTDVDINAALGGRWFF